MSKARHSIIAVAAAALLAAGLGPAAAKPSSQEIAKARATCAAHKAKVQKLERTASADDARLADAKRTWERSCQAAEVLINEAQGTPPPRVVPPT